MIVISNEVRNLESRDFYPVVRKSALTDDLI